MVDLRLQVYTDFQTPRELPNLHTVLLVSLSWYYPKVPPLFFQDGTCCSGIQLTTKHHRPLPVQSLIHPLILKTDVRIQPAEMLASRILTLKTVT